MRILMKKTVAKAREKGGWYTFAHGSEYEVEDDLGCELCAADVATVCSPGFTAKPKPFESLPKITFGETVIKEPESVDTEPED